MGFGIQCRVFIEVVASRQAVMVDQWSRREWLWIFMAVIELCDIKDGDETYRREHLFIPTC